MNIESLISELKNNFSKQNDCHEEFIYEFKKKYGLEVVAENLDVDKHRWYETSIVVYKVNTDGGIKYIGARFCTDVFSEEGGIDDIGWEPWYGEMIEKQVTTYVIK